MIKRILSLAVTVALLVCLFAVPVFAEDTVVNGNTVIDYMDYITGYDLSFAADGWAYLNFKESFFTSAKTDTNGFNSSDNGDRVWNVSIPNSDTYSSFVVSYIPGEYINNTYLKLDNIPSGSRFWMQIIADPKLDTGIQTQFLFRLRSGVVYFDADFNPILYDFGEPSVFSFESYDGGGRFSRIVELTVTPPEGAVYCTLQSECFFAIGRTNDIHTSSFDIEFQFSQPNLKISTSYTKIILESIVKAKPPEGYGTIIDLGELENILNGTTGEGVESADDIFQSAPEVIGQFFSGFLFMNYVISSLSASSWLSSLFTVSLALGLFAFITNAGISIGRSIEHKSKGGKI